MLMPLFFRATMTDSRDELNKNLRRSLFWWLRLLHSSAEAFKRVAAVSDEQGRSTFIIYTDASPEYLAGVGIAPSGERWWFSVPVWPGGGDIAVLE